MGYPASAALLFKALTEDTDKWLHQDAKNIVSKFSLFAIILADPKKDPIFYQHLQDNFSFYDRLTGKNFMFFSIIKETDVDTFNGAYKEYKIFNDVEAYKQNLAAEKTKHSELAIHAICAILGIDYDETPCLIISNNLRFGQFCKITTGINQLEKQLLALRTVADYLSTQTALISLSGLLNKINETHVFYDTLENLVIDKDSIKFISEILQVVSNEGMFSDKTFANLKNKIYLKSLAIEKSQLSERIQEAMSLLGALNKGILWDMDQLVHFKIRSVDEDSFDYIKKNPDKKTENISLKLHNDWHNVQASTKNHLECSAYMEKNMMHLFHSTGDYSTLSFPLCKSFETEITYSVVQLIRQHLGINMPRYFSKYCPNVNNLPITPLITMVNNPREIFFNNKRNDGKWIPPGLGEARLGFATLKANENNFASDWQSIEKIKILLTQWEVIQKVRNKSAHLDVVTKEDKERLDKSINELHSANLLNALTQLKMRLNH